MSGSRNRARRAAGPRGTTVVPSRRPASLTRDRVIRASRYLTTHVWGIGLVALVVVIALHLGALDWFTDGQISDADGSSERLPNTFASVDHPFHIAKERAVLDALRAGEFPRWISNHQAGYPAEFYPLGADLIVSAGWALGLGLIPLEVVHKLVVIGVLFVPVASYWSIARRDGWPASVAVTAALLQLFVPGSWLGGGPDELLRMGMWPNVFATYLMLPLMLWAADYLRRADRRGFVLAACAASLAIYTNPRSLIAVAFVLASVGTLALIERGPSSPTARRPGSRPVRRPSLESASRLVLPIVRRSFLLAGAILLLCGTLFVPLRARQGLYEFARFVEFSSAATVWEYFSGALPIEIFALATLGAVIAHHERRFHGRVLALWMPLAALGIVAIGWPLRDLSVFAQLEGPRLLPIVRLPALFLAAIGVHGVVAYGLRIVTHDDSRRVTSIGAVAAAALFVLTPVSMLSATERGLPALETTDQPAFAAIARSARVYALNATPEDRPLVIGSSISDQASFWIPALTSSDAFHVAWVWYWRTPAYADKTRLADLPSSLNLDFLNRHGLTFVLVATNVPDVLSLARAKSYLRLVDPGTTGGYAIFRVDDNDPSTRGPISTSRGQVTALDISRERLRAVIRSTAPTDVTIAINAYPAWRATVNGLPAPIRRSEDGYMVVGVPAGDTEVTLDYQVEPVVWYGRALTVLGLLSVLAVVVPRRRHRDAM